MKEKRKAYLMGGLPGLTREEQAQIHVLVKNKPWLEPDQPIPQQTVNEFR